MFDEYIEAVLQSFREAGVPANAHDVSLQVVDTMCAQGKVDKDIDSIDLAMQECEQRVEEVLRRG